MIRLLDAAVLAGTKLRTRKVRTIVTAVLASLLFAGLVFAFTVVRGAVDGYARFSQNGLSQRYITGVTFVTGQSDVLDMSSAALIVKAKALNKQIIEQKKADAKRLGISYDPATEPTVTMSDALSGSTTEYLNAQNYAVQQILKEETAKLKTPAQKTKEVTAAYDPVAFYAAKPFGDTTNLKIMKGGKESFTTATDQMNNPYEQNSPATLSYIPRTIVNSFLLEGADLTVAKDVNAAVPVIVPYVEAEKALGLVSLPKTATDTERLVRINEVKRRAVNVTMALCYRNSASQQMIEQTKQQILDIEKHKNDKTYEKPSQIYALPDVASCGSVLVTKDTRSTEEKNLAAKQREFNLKYNLETEPVQRKVTVRIVGLSPNAPDYASLSTMENLALMIGGASLMGQWAIPSELVDTSVQDTFISQVDGENMAMAYYGIPNLVEFGSPSDAKRFVTEQGCSGMDCNTKPSVAYFGSNSVLIDNIMSGAANVLQLAGLIVSAVAAVLMMGMVGRVITDSRRETAVFRAIGAKRNDIRIIYSLYVVAFALCIALLAVGIGMGAAWVYSNSVSESLTVSARLMFIESRETAPFTLVAVWPQALLLTVGGIVVVGLISMLLPLSRNLARSPLKDMRDE